MRIHTQVTTVILDPASPNPVQNTSYKQQTKKKYKPKHQQIGLPPHLALPIREEQRKTNQQTNKKKNQRKKNLAQISPYKKLIQTTGQILEGRNQQVERIQPRSLEKADLKHNKLKKNDERQRNTTQMKEQTRNSEVQINEEEIGKLPGKKFRTMIVKMIKNLESKMEKLQESINKDIEELKNKHAETNNTITEIKNTLEGINSRLSEAEE